MILFKVAYQNLPITDWVQAFGALIAIIAAVIGFVKLFKRDTDRQKQIESLIKLAEQSEIQANQSINMAEYLNQSNTLLSEQVNLLQEAISTWGKDADIAQKRLEHEEKAHKHVNLPRFEFKYCTGHAGEFNLKFINKGKICTLERLEILPEDKNSSIRLVTKENSSIDTGEIIEVRVISAHSINSPEVSFNIFVLDIENNRYVQHVHGNPMKPKIDFPVEHLT
jgi:flagellar biogenesis protein FliO